MLEIGKVAPNFTLPDQNGNPHTLSDYHGKKVILYFYPRDNTAGCTKQACNFKALMPQFSENGAVILGVSKDSVASHKRFYGKVSMGVVRTTYLIDENGIIVRAYDKVKATDNPGQMLEELATLNIVEKLDQ